MALSQSQLQFGDPVEPDGVGEGAHGDRHVGLQAGQRPIGLVWEGVHYEGDFHPSLVHHPGSVGNSLVARLTPGTGAGSEAQLPTILTAGEAHPYGESCGRRCLNGGPGVQGPDQHLHQYQVDPSLGQELGLFAIVGEHRLVGWE